MPNAPMLGPYSDPLRPPRQDRLHELAAFHLGYRPYELWCDFAYKRTPDPQPACARWLRELPLHLHPFASPSGWECYSETLREALTTFASSSTETEPVSGEWVDPAEWVVNASNSTEDIPNDPPPMVTPPPADLVVTQAGLSDRDTDVFWLGTFGGDPVGHGLIRVAKSIGESLPEHLEPWFRFGETLGRCAADTTPECRDREIADVRQAVLLGARGTDIYLAEDAIDERLRRGMPDDDDEGLPDWDYPVIEKLIDDVTRFLEDEPRILLRESCNYLWFLGTRVKLTAKETELLAAIATSADDIVPRKYLAQTVLCYPMGSEHKVDQLLQAIVNKVTKSLKRVGSTYFRRDDKATREWLRTDFIAKEHGVGWRRGSLFEKMVIVK